MVVFLGFRVDSDDIQKLHEHIEQIKRDKISKVLQKIPDVLIHLINDYKGNDCCEFDGQYECVKSTLENWRLDNDYNIYFSMSEEFNLYDLSRTLNDLTNDTDTEILENLLGREANVYPL
jgi:hypothetical protein